LLPYTTLFRSAGQTGQFLPGARWPVYHETVDLVGVPQPQVDDVRHLRAVAVDGVLFAHQLPAVDEGDEPGPDPQAVALRAAQRHLEVVPFREVIFVKQDRSAAHLPDDQVELAVVAKITGHDRATIAVAIGCRERTDIQKIPAAHRAGDVEEDALALVATEI